MKLKALGGIYPPRLHRNCVLYVSELHTVIRFVLIMIQRLRVSGDTASYIGFNVLAHVGRWLKENSEDEMTITNLFLPVRNGCYIVGCTPDGCTKCTHDETAVLDHRTIYRNDNFQ